MTSLKKRIGTAIHNGYVERRNKFVAGDYHVKDKATKAAGYLQKVGNNIVTDVQEGQPRNAFPFQMPQEHTNLFKQPHRNDRHKRKRHREHHNPYSLI